MCPADSCLDNETSDPKIEVSVQPQWLDQDECGARYGFSGRHWGRLADRGLAPHGIKFGHLRRWSVRTLLDWECAGCPRVG